MSETDVSALHARLAELEAENARLREGLAPFAAVADLVGGDEVDGVVFWDHTSGKQIKASDFARAAALANTAEGK